MKYKVIEKKLLTLIAQDNICAQYFSDVRKMCKIRWNDLFNFNWKFWIHISIRGINVFNQRVTMTTRLERTIWTNTKVSCQKSMFKRNCKVHLFRSHEATLYRCCIWKLIPNREDNQINFHVNLPCLKLLEV